MESLEFRAMGSRILAILDDPSPHAKRRLADVPRWFEGWEACLSRFREESELSRLNRSDGVDVPVSGVLWDVLEASMNAADASRGIVVPTVLEAVRAAGYDRSWETIAAEGTGVPVREAVGVPDWSRIERDPRRHTVRLPPGTTLDLGGVGKGWAADQAARRLGAFGAALVDAGGDIAVSGPANGDEAWPIGVADPAHEDQELVQLQIWDGGVATSGREYRRWRRGDGWAHHLIDPRTGRPAETDVLTATVVAPSAAEAEMGAKTVAILGSRDGVRWLESHKRLAGLVVLEDGRVVTSRRMKTYMGS
jgi:thiamine biosynthesis lipoprotein